MHHAFIAVIFVLGVKAWPTMPYSRPSGRRILYTRRSRTRTSSSLSTVTSVSLYISTAFVFSSWAGTGAFTCERIQSGASDALATVPAPTHTASVSSVMPRNLLLWRARLHHDLLFIGRPHKAIKIL